MSAFLNTVVSEGAPNRSPVDDDFYKFVMLNFILKFYPNVQVKFQLINRDKNIPLAQVVDERDLRSALDHRRAIKFGRRDRDTNIAYLRGMRMHGQSMFDEEYFAFLEERQLPPYELRRVGDQYDLSSEGLWQHVDGWEIPMMQIPVELYFRELLRRMSPMQREILYSRAKDKLYRMLSVLASSKYKPRVVHFGTRRRHSFLWEKFTTEMCKEVLGEQLVGTSNVWMAHHFDLMPMGTNAHALPMVVTAIAPDDEKPFAQFKVLEQWQELYGVFLRICLGDTYGLPWFLAHAPEWLVNWRGFRDDSGDVFENIERYLNWYKEHGVLRPKEAGKLIIPSDGLDELKVLKLCARFDRHINLSFGIGTNITNLFLGCHPTPTVKVPGLDITWEEAFRAFSIVCKVVSADGEDAVKISNNIAKATGKPEAVAKYAGMFGDEGRIEEQPTV